MIGYGFVGRQLEILQTTTLHVILNVSRIVYLITIVQWNHRLKFNVSFWLDKTARPGQAEDAVCYKTHLYKGV